MPILNITNSGTKWRVFEKEKLSQFFGEVIDVRLGDLEYTRKLVDQNKDFYIFWRPNSDQITSDEYDMLQKQRNMLRNFRMINDPIHYLNTHCKEFAFNIWNKNKHIKIPKYQIIEDDQEFLENCNLSFPMLVRLNNEVTGRASYLVKDRHSLRNNLDKLNIDYNRAKQQKSFTKKIAVEFIDATKENGLYNMSYRVIVAGNKVITGYSRLSEATDWVAITGKFKYEMGELFLKYQERCNEMIKNNHDIIVESVTSLGLNLQGVDIIEDQDENIYFLECQPGFSTGYANWPKPFYNPHYPELVRFIMENEKQFRSRCPLYYNIWLDKKNLFNQIFKSLKEGLDEQQMG